jgi:DNA-binding transcriptional regulator/RsmH inhibitor MraZ
MLTTSFEKNDMTDKLYMGSALCGVEPDGAIILPSFVRAPLALRSDGTTILLGSHEADICLAGYDPAQAAELQLECRRRRLEEEVSQPGACHARARRIFGLLHAVPVNAEGRCALPTLLRRRARIRDTALVVGTGEGFEIWGLQVALYHHDGGMRALAALSVEVSQAA